MLANCAVLAVVTLVKRNAICMVSSSYIVEEFRFESEDAEELLLEGGLIRFVDRRRKMGGSGVIWKVFVVGVMVPVLIVGGMMGRSLVRSFSLNQCERFLV